MKVKVNFLCLLVILVQAASVFSFEDSEVQKSASRIKRGIFDDIFRPTPAPTQAPTGPTDARCGQRYSIEPSASYSIKTPFFDYSLNYPPSHTCSWEFFGSGGCKPMVNCSSFKVVESSNCTSDYLEVGDGVGASQKFCGTNPPQNVSSGISILRLFFRGGPFITARGFHCIVSCATTTVNSTANSTVSTVNTIPNALGKPKTDNCTCGIPGTIHRVVGGMNALPDFWKWQTAMVFRGRAAPFCGGSIINSKYILTAAHCVVTTGLIAFPAAAEVVFNEYDTSISNETKTIRRNIRAIISHPFYDPLNQDYDIAVLEIYPELNFTSTEEPSLSPVCLPPRGSFDSYENVTATVTGFGTLTEGGDQATVLQQASIPVISNADCNKQYENRITPRMLCAQFKNGGVDSCQGDSGGPFQYSSSNNKYTQIGVVSWGEGCARSDRPGVYSRVTDLNDWIHQVSWTGTWCMG